MNIIFTDLELALKEKEFLFEVLKTIAYMQATLARVIVHPRDENGLNWGIDIRTEPHSDHFLTAINRNGITTFC